MLQTTNDIFNMQLYSLVKPQSLFAWQRVRVANMMAHSGQEWYRTVGMYNSGTFQSISNAIVWCRHCNVRDNFGNIGSWHSMQSEHGVLLDLSGCDWRMHGRCQRGEGRAPPCGGNCPPVPQPLPPSCPPVPQWRRPVALLVLFCADFYSGVIQCFAASFSKPFDFIWILYLLTTLVIGSSLFWEMMLWLSVSVSCIRYSKRHKFRPQMHQNAFGDRAPPGLAGGA